MGKRRPVTDEEAVAALGYAVTCAIHWAPESLLLRFSTEKREIAARRLAIRVLTQLAGDGFAEGHTETGGMDLFTAIATGIDRGGDHFLRTFPEARRGHKRVLDAIGLHFGGVILSVMYDGRVWLKRRTPRQRPANNVIPLKTRNARIAAPAAIRNQAAGCLPVNTR